MNADKNGRAGQWQSGHSYLPYLRQSWRYHATHASQHKAVNGRQVCHLHLRYLARGHHAEYALTHNLLGHGQGQYAQSLSLGRSSHNHQQRLAPHGHSHGPQADAQQQGLQCHDQQIALLLRLLLFLPRCKHQPANQQRQPNVPRPWPTRPLPRPQL